MRLEFTHLSLQFELTKNYTTGDALRAISMHRKFISSTSSLLVVSCGKMNEHFSCIIEEWYTSFEGICLKLHLLRRNRPGTSSFETKYAGNFIFWDEICRELHLLEQNQSHIYLWSSSYILYRIILLPRDGKSPEKLNDFEWIWKRYI